MLYTLIDAFLHYYPHLLLVYVLTKTFPAKTKGRKKTISVLGCYCFLVFWDWFRLNAVNQIVIVGNEKIMGTVVSLCYIGTAVLFALLYLEGWIWYKLTLVMMWWFFWGVIRSLLFAVVILFYGENAVRWILWILTANNILLTMFSLFLIKLKVSSVIKIPRKICIAICILCFIVEETIIATDGDMMQLREIQFLYKEVLIFILLIGIMVFSYCCLSFLLKYFETLILQKHQMDLQKMELQSAEMLFAQNRKFSHDMKNHMLLLSALLEQKKYEEATGFFKNYQIENCGVLNYSSTGNTIIDVILFRERMKAEELHVPFETQVIAPAKLSISAVDISSVLFNLLDNALEASKKLQNPQIIFRLRKEKNYILISVENRVEGRILQENPFLETTKTDKTIHGNGIKIVKQIVSRNGGDLKFDQEGDLFRSRIMLKDE